MRASLSQLFRIVRRRRGDGRRELQQEHLARQHVGQFQVVVTRGLASPSSVVAPISTSLASAAICSVSSVMKLACTQAARPAFTVRSLSRDLSVVDELFRLGNRRRVGLCCGLRIGSSSLSIHESTREIQHQNKYWDDNKQPDGFAHGQATSGRTL